jgi:hypothetical protein
MALGADYSRKKPEAKSLVTLSLEKMYKKYLIEKG